MFKNLNLNRDGIENAIKFFCECNYKKFSINKEDKNNFIRYNIEYENNNLFLDIFFVKNGTTTIHINNGKNQSEKEKIAKYIINSDFCKIPNNNINNRIIVIKNIKIEDFEAIMKLLPSEKYFSAIISRNDSENSILIKLEGSLNEKVTLTYYKTKNKLMIQGRPLPLHSSIVSLFNELVDENNIAEYLSKSYNVDISNESIQEQYKAFLPKSHDKHTDKMKKSLLKSVYNLNLPKQKYTCTELLFEPLRVLEGHLRYVLQKDYNIVPSNDFGNLDMFSYDKATDEVNMTNAAINKISDSEKIEYFKEAYNFFREHRHKLFHWDITTINDNLVDTTEQIDDIIQVKNTIKEILQIIDKYY